MLRIEAINQLEDFFHAKKLITLEAIGRDPSHATTDIYIRGFMRQLMERLWDICPELRSSSGAYQLPYEGYSRRHSTNSRNIRDSNYNTES